MIEGIYYFGEHQRWNLGWPNPNPGGAFIATLLPFFWWLQAVLSQASRLRPQGLRWSLRLLLLAMELGLWLLLIKTYSRGALVAVGAAGLFWIVARRGAMEWVVPLVRIASIAALLFATDAIQRTEPNYLAADRSVSNRIDLWSGGLQMVALRPFSGWGQGESGPQYMHWFQEVDATEGYAGMVNSYLHRAVEYGVPSLLPWLFGLCWIALIGLSPGKNSFCSPGRALLLAAAASSLIAFAAANLFSTLWIFKHLWWVPAVAVTLAVVLIVSEAWKSGRYRRWATRCAVAAVFLSVTVLQAVIAAGTFLARDTAVTHSKGMLHFGDMESETRWLILADEAVLGNDYGKEVRRLAAVLNEKGIRLSAPLSREEHPSDPSAFDTILLTGRYSGYVAEYATQASRFILIHPAGEVPEHQQLAAEEVTLFRPMIDPNRHGTAWQELAIEHQWPVESSGAIGLDARPVWPEFFLYEIQEKL